MIALQPLLAPGRSGCNIDLLGLWKSVCFCRGHVSKGDPLCWLVGAGWVSCVGAETHGQAGRSSAGWDLGALGAGVSASSPAAGRSTTPPAHGTAELLQASWLRSSLKFEGKDRVFCCFFRTWGSLAVRDVVGIILHCFGGKKETICALGMLPFEWESWLEKETERRKVRAKALVPRGLLECVFSRWKHPQGCSSSFITRHRSSQSSALLDR